jgi:hypothetical protein
LVGEAPASLIDRSAIDCLLAGFCGRKQIRTQSARGSAAFCAIRSEKQVGD